METAYIIRNGVIIGGNGADGFSPVITVEETTDGHTVKVEDSNGLQQFEVLNGKDGVQIDDTTTSTDTVWSSKKTSDEIAKVETELNAKLGDKADKTELNKHREIRVDEIYDSNSYYRVDAIGYYARPLYFRVVSTNGGEEILSFGQSVTSERKVIGKSVNATFKYIPPASNASNGTLFIKTNKADTSLTIFYTQIYSLASIPTLRDSTAEEYATGTDFNVQELATMDKLNYSTTETPIGTWIDGKPIYRKTFYSATGYSKSEQQIGTISNLKLVTNIRTVGKSGGVNYWCSQYLDDAQCNAYVKNTGEVHVYNRGVGFVQQEQLVVVEYTKTTD